MPARRRLALVVIARDESARIRRLLDSVAPWVDAMLVLDTGSTDDTPAIAAACGAAVHHAGWTGDFAAARNTALDLAGADWHLVLDADEWLIDGGPALAALRDRPPDVVGALRFQDHYADGAERVAQTWMSRVFPPALRYRGRVHEQVEHTLPVRRLDVVIGHDGYLPERLESKRGRNRTLLERELAERPREAYLWYQLGKDCDVYGEHAAAEAAFARAAALGGADHGWWHDLVVRRLFGLKQLKRHDQGMALAEREIARCQDLPDFFFAVGDLLLDLAADEPARAGSLVPMIESAWQRCLAIGERPDLPGTVAGRGSHLAAHNLALVLEFSGRAAEAQALRARHALPSL